jgi:hypothetical protein
MDAAADHLTAHLEPRTGSPLKRAWDWTVAIVLGLLSLGDSATPLDLVIRRIDTGKEVMRTPADIGSPDFLIEQVREDLATKTVEEFFAEWRLD